VPGLLGGGDGARTALDSIGRRWVAGATVDFAALHAGERRRRVRLPTYPFERRPYLVPALAHHPIPQTQGARPS
jgi:phthiocerol/phenolphthiocerol synthesis type-I polyketide synthase E